MIGISVNRADLGAQGRQDLAREIPDAFAVDFIRVEPYHPVGSRLECSERRERAVSHIGEIDERMAVDVEFPALGERARFKGGEVRALRPAGVVVDDEDVDGVADRCERRSEIGFGRCADAEGTRDRDR